MAKHYCNSLAKKNNFILFGFLTISLLVGCVNGSNDDDSQSDATENELVGLDEVDESIAMYKNNSLSTGECPYSDYYGKNKDCTSYYCSMIEVDAPYDCDVVVVIKKGNEDGSVVAHSYIERGDSYTFSLADGVYQVFFYMGNGWNPEKEMSGGVQGGFVKDESFSKDYPQELESCKLTYELIHQRNGNFQTKPSSESEMF